MPLDELVFDPTVYDGRSIVNLVSSIVEAAGGQPCYPGLEGLDTRHLAKARHIVLLVVDGLGAQWLRSRRGGAVLRRHTKDTVSSVFPPTTATAVTTYLTGLAPRQHGLTGWFMYFRELGSVIAVLPFVTRLGRVPLQNAGVDVRMLLGHVPVFDGMRRATFSIAPLRIAHSEFNQSHLGKAQLSTHESLPEFFAAIEHVIGRSSGPSFSYAYWPELDHLSHLHGVASPLVEAHLTALDAGFDELLHRLKGTDTLVLLTADHGFVDVEPERVVDLGDHPALRASLRAPLCGEPRTAYCYVSPGKTQAFLDYTASAFAGCAVCVESRALIERGYFGGGVSHPELVERVGDFTLLMREGYAIADTLPGEERPKVVGMHGGLSAEELEVPLIVAEA